jgi:hypothetical protein
MLLHVLILTHKRRLTGEKDGNRLTGMERIGS